MKQRREPIHHGWTWLVYALLYAASVPWYLPAGASPKIWLGLPHWAMISLLSIAGIAIFTAFVIHRFWDDSDPS